MNNPSKFQCKTAWLALLLMLFPSVISLASSLLEENLSGELWMSGTASVNGIPAVNGMTLFSGKRIITGLDGMVAANLGKLGSATLRAETDFTLEFATNTISGNLVKGTVVINIPSEVAVRIKTPVKEVTLPVSLIPTTVAVEVTATGTQTFFTDDVQSESQNNQQNTQQNNQQGNPPGNQQDDQGRPRTFLPFERTRKPLSTGILLLLAGGTVGTFAGVEAFLFATDPPPLDATF